MLHLLEEAVSAHIVCNYPVTDMRLFFTQSLIYIGVNSRIFISHFGLQSHMTSFSCSNYSCFCY